MKIARIIELLESSVPLSLQESYDNCGLQCGDPSDDTESALLALDCTEAVVDEAIALGCKLIIVHHPLIFSPLKRLVPGGAVSRILIKAIRNHIAIYAIHTNLDNHHQGVNLEILERLGLKPDRILAPIKGGLRQLTVYIPKAATEKVAQALFEAGAGRIGNYSHASFRTAGTGTFKGEEGSQPVIGQSGVYETVEEDRLELIYPFWKEPEVLRALRQSHPYEEIAYQIITLQNENQQTGAGMLGIQEEEDVLEFLKRLKKVLGCGVIRHTAVPEGLKVSKVAVCGGAGRFLLPDAIRSGAQVLVTSDFKYHDFFESEGKIVVADVGHYESEQFTPHRILRMIREKMPTFGVLLSQVNTNPVNYL